MPIIYNVTGGQGGQPPQLPPPANPGGPPQQQAPSVEIHNPLLHELRLPKSPVLKPVSRFLTFLAGIAFTFLMFMVAYAIIFIGFDIDPTPWRRFWLFLACFVVFFIFGLVDNVDRRKQQGSADAGSGKDGDKKRPADTLQEPIEDEEANYHGVVKAFNSPLSEGWRFVLPTGTNWLIPGLMEVGPVDMREQAIDIPPASDKENKNGFEVESISTYEIQIPLEFQHLALPRKARKIVPMLVKIRVRAQVYDQYQYYMSNPKTVEGTIVSGIVQTMRHIASNGNYPGNRDIPVEDDFDLMRKKDELGRAITEDLKSDDQFGIDVFEVIIRSLRPKDDELFQRYMNIAREIADQQSQTIEGIHIQNLIQLFKGRDPDMPRSEALLYAALTAGKTTLEAFKGLAGLPIFQLPAGGKAPSSPTK